MNMWEIRLFMLGTWLNDKRDMSGKDSVAAHNFRELRQPLACADILLQQNLHCIHIILWKHQSQIPRSQSYICTHIYMCENCMCIWICVKIHVKVLPMCISICEFKNMSIPVEQLYPNSTFPSTYVNTYMNVYMRMCENMREFWAILVCSVLSMKHAYKYLW